MKKLSLEFLRPVIVLMYTRLLEVDDFIAKLWDIHLKVKNEGYPQVLQSPALAFHLEMMSPHGCKGYFSRSLPIGLYDPSGSLGFDSQA